MDSKRLAEILSSKKNTFVSLLKKIINNYNYPVLAACEISHFLTGWSKIGYFFLILEEQYRSTISSTILPQSDLPSFVPYMMDSEDLGLHFFFSFRILRWLSLTANRNTTKKKKKKANLPRYIATWKV